MSDKLITLNNLKEFKSKCDTTYAKVGTGGGGTTVIANKAPSEDYPPVLTSLQVGDTNYVIKLVYLASTEQTLSPEQIKELKENLNTAGAFVLLEFNPNNDSSYVTTALTKYDLIDPKSIEVSYINYNNELVVKSLDTTTGIWTTKNEIGKQVALNIEGVKFSFNGENITDGMMTIIISRFFFQLLAPNVDGTNIDEWWKEAINSNQGEIFTALAYGAVYSIVWNDFMSVGRITSVENGENVYMQCGTKVEAIFHLSKLGENFSSSRIEFLYV